MKKLLIIVTFSVMLVSLTACGSSKKTDTDQSAAKKVEAGVENSSENESDNKEESKESTVIESASVDDEVTSVPEATADTETTPEEQQELQPNYTIKWEDIKYIPYSGYDYQMEKLADAVSTDNSDASQYYMEIGFNVLSQEEMESMKTKILACGDPANDKFDSVDTGDPNILQYELIVECYGSTITYYINPVNGIDQCTITYKIYG